MGELQGISQQELAGMIADGRAIVSRLLGGGAADGVAKGVGKWVERLEPLLDGGLKERERSELWSCRRELETGREEHVLVDAGFRLLSLLEEIESSYTFARA